MTACFLFLQAEKAHEGLQLVGSLQTQLAGSQQLAESLQRQVAELQQHNMALQQDNSEKADFIQSFFNAAATHAKRPRMSETTSLQT